MQYNAQALCLGKTIYFHQMQGESIYVAICQYQMQTLVKLCKLGLKKIYDNVHALNNHLKPTESLNSKYSRTSVARTLMARLPWLFRTRSRVSWKKNP